MYFFWRKVVGQPLDVLTAAKMLKFKGQTTAYEVPLGQPAQASGRRHRDILKSPHLHAHLRPYHLCSYGLRDKLV